MRTGKLEIRDAAHDHTHTLVLLGELDLRTATDLEAAIVPLCEAGAKEIVLDLRQLGFLDSAGVRAIVSSQERCRKHGCEFFLTPGRQAIERLFEVIGMTHETPRFRESTGQ